MAHLEGLMKDLNAITTAWPPGSALPHQELYTGKAKGEKKTTKFFKKNPITRKRASTRERWREEERKQLEVPWVSPALVLQRGARQDGPCQAAWHPAGLKQSKVDSPLGFFFGLFVFFFLVRFCLSGVIALPFQCWTLAFMYNFICVFILSFFIKKGKKKIVIKKKKKGRNCCFPQPRLRFDCLFYCVWKFIASVGCSVLFFILRTITSPSGS